MVWVDKPALKCNLPVFASKRFSLKERKDLCEMHPIEPDTTTSLSLPFNMKLCSGESASPSRQMVAAGQQLGDGNSPSLDHEAG